MFLVLPRPTAVRVYVVESTDTNPALQELLELKQLYVKATGTAFGPPPSDKKAKKGKGKAPASGGGGGGGGGQPKQMDTRKADKAKKVSLTTAVRYFYCTNTVVVLVVRTKSCKHATG